MNPKYKNVFFSPNLGAGFDTPDVEPIEDEEQDSHASEESVTRVKPKTRREYFLSGIAGNEIPVNPKSRREYFLSGVAGNENPINPKSREERLMSEIAQGSGSGEEPFEVVYAPNEVGDPGISCDHTYAEIMGALDDGKRVTAKFDVGVEEPLESFIVTTINNGVIGAMFMTYSDDIYVIGVLAHDSSNVITMPETANMFFGSGAIDPKAGV